MSERKITHSDYRYERKFFISSLSKFDVEQIVKYHPAIFSEIFYTRKVNNIYFDTYNLKNYIDNVNGNTERIKVRIRWYGDMFGYIKKPVLELKIKRGLLGKKISTPINSFTLDDKTSIQTIIQHLADSDISNLVDFQSLMPTLLNQYSRNYYLSSNGKYRITLDTVLKYYAINAYDNTFLDHNTDSDSVILELKYDKESDSSSDIISNYFPFRMTKSSKYVTGIETLYADVLHQ
ncbi:MAG: VTC domain-containing protein [Bacteroidetes bacterium]|jgi:SPX domain protein involved in polyphosphate accumulation|nr:VTC domain-containing protein [Bacteroidota bacterium]MBT7995283.1 VTC domain-containing protein [Bacteroidota bacterium]